MSEIMEMIHYWLFIVIDITTLLIYLLSIVIILKGTILSVIALFKKMDKTPGIYIGESLDLALRYLMVTEVLHTFTADTLVSLVNLGILLAIRVAIVMFNQKETEHELHLMEEEQGA